jgi:hypothetical protein
MRRAARQHPGGLPPRRLRPATPGARHRHLPRGRADSECLVLRPLALPALQRPKPLLWLIGPLLDLPRRYAARNVGFPLRFDNTYARRDLQMELRPVDETVVDAVQQMLDDGVVKRKD